MVNREWLFYLLLKTYNRCFLQQADASASGALARSVGPYSLLLNNKG